jgi:ubiquinone/menaquinone biosynthesis C-methylase UbiE
VVLQYRAAAAAFRDAVEAHGVSVAGARVLDAGTGSGRLAFALAGLGGAEVVGVDLDPEAGVPSLEREPVRERLTGGRDVLLVTADVSRLDTFEDGSFDLVCSMSAVEHFEDLPAVLSELARVLRPGGLMHHGVDPWFGKAGGHSLCTLDFPWGHLRLTDDELARYLAEQRPYERDDALEFHRHGFQVPRRTLTESRAAFEAAGLEILDWRELPVRLRDPHRRLAGEAVLRECRHQYPAVTLRDLLTISYGVVARRPPQ